MTFLRGILLFLNIFLSATAVLGGIWLLSGANGPPASLLIGSPFTSYLLPGLALVIVVGGFAAMAVVLMVKRHPFATLASAAGGLSIVVFVVVQILVIGTPAGMAGPLQIFYIGLGLLLVVLSLTYNALERN